MQTLREHFSSQSSENLFIRLIYEEWKYPGSTKCEQKTIPYSPVKEVLEKYEDWWYRSAYTTFNSVMCMKIDVWALATDERVCTNE